MKPMTHALRNRPVQAAAALAALAAVMAFAATGARAELFLVTDTTDGIPAPPGSLREAVEKSESNPGPDRIDFAIDGGTITLVAPLPDLLDGGLTIGTGRDGRDFPGSNGIFVSGGGVVPRLFRIASSDNTLSDLDFIEFAGTEVVLIRGGDGTPVQDNTIAHAVFGSDLPDLANVGVAVRIDAVEGGSLPARTRISANRFEGNGGGVVIEGSNFGPSEIEHWTWIDRNGFNVAADDGPGIGTGRPVLSTHGGHVHVTDNRFVGPGPGVLLEAGSNGSEVLDNTFGQRDNLSLQCIGYSGPAVEVQGSHDVVVWGNSILCGDQGVRIGTNAQRAEVRSNRIGTASQGVASDAVQIQGVSDALVRRNTVRNSGAWAVSGSNAPGTDPNAGIRLVCNEVWDNAAGAFDLPGVTTLPPILGSASPIAVLGTDPNGPPGFTELFADDLGQGRIFQGARFDDLNDPDYRQPIPVVDLRVDRSASGAEITFDRTVPPDHTATATELTPEQTSELSGPIPAEKDGLVFDVIRGDLANLTFGFAGGIVLGDVDCLANGILPDPSPAVPVVDAVVPIPGQGFFYLARKRISGAANGIGTYDPAICLTDVRDYSGPREPTTGDCPPN